MQFIKGLLLVAALVGVAHTQNRRGPADLPARSVDRQSMTTARPHELGPQIEPPQGTDTPKSEEINSYHDFSSRDFNPFNYNLRRSSPRYEFGGPALSYSGFQRPNYYFGHPLEQDFRNHPSPFAPSGFDSGFNSFGSPRRYHVHHEYGDNVECKHRKKQHSPREHERPRGTPSPEPPQEPNFHQRYDFGPDGFQTFGATLAPSSLQGQVPGQYAEANEDSSDETSGGKPPQRNHNYSRRGNLPRPSEVARGPGSPAGQHSEVSEGSSEETSGGEPQQRNHNYSRRVGLPRLVEGSRGQGSPGQHSEAREDSSEETNSGEPQQRNHNYSRRVGLPRPIEGSRGQGSPKRYTELRRGTSAEETNSEQPDQYARTGRPRRAWMQR